MGELSSLQQAVNYRTYLAALKKIRNTARGSAVGGAILTILGIATWHLSSINGFLVLLGLFLLIEGIWLERSPSLKGLLIDGIALLAIGIWNVFISCFAGAFAPAFFLIFGLCQMVWGSKSCSRYKRLSSLTIEQPSAETAQQLEDMVAVIAAQDPGTAEDIITFRELNSPKNRYWKGRLAKQMGVFVLGQGEDVIVAGKDQICIARRGILLNDTFQVGTHKMRGYISPELFRRYEAWVETAAPSAGL
jgi:hypothetical protein